MRDAEIGRLDQPEGAHLHTMAREMHNIEKVIMSYYVCMGAGACFKFQATAPRLPRNTYKNKSSETLKSTGEMQWVGTAHDMSHEERKEVASRSH